LFGPCIFIIEGRTDQRNAQINFSLINLLLFNWVAETCRSNLNNNKLMNEKLICAFRWSVLPSMTVQISLVSVCCHVCSVHQTLPICGFVHSGSAYLWYSYCGVVPPRIHSCTCSFLWYIILIFDKRMPLTTTNVVGAINTCYMFRSLLTITR